MLDAALGAIPESLQGLGESAVRIDQLQAHRQKAQDTLDAALSDQLFAQRYQAKVAELQEGDYRVLPTAVVEAGNQLAGEIATERNLSPQAKALMSLRTQERITVAQQHGLTFATKRRDEEATYAMTLLVQDAQQRMAAATNPYEEAVALGQFDETLRGFAATGLGHGAPLAEIRQKTLDAVADQRVQTAIQANPDAMKAQLHAQAAGEPTREDLPAARPASLASLAQHATEVSRSRFAEAEHHERYEDYLLKKRQERAGVDLRTAIYTTKPTPENVPTFQRLIDRAAAAMKDGTVDPATGEHIMHTAQIHQVAAANPPVVKNNEEVLRTVTLAIYRAESPAQFDQARAILTEAGVQALEPDTYGKLHDKLDQREKGSYWRNRPAVVAAKDVLMRSALVPYGGSLAGQMKPKMQQKLSWAIDSLENQLQGLAQQDIREVDKQAVDLAWQARIQFMKPEKDDPAEDYLPAEAQAAKTAHDLAQVLVKLRGQGWADGALAQILQNWHTWQDYEQAALGRRPTQTPGAVAPTPKAYQLPPTGGTKPTERRSN